MKSGAVTHFKSAAINVFADIEKHHAMAFAVGKDARCKY